ncbi:hypothetical protein SLEP1_g17035 [Rubroshorea leprosula]|uniref:Uncharacterized protein n=1 Tax=Rubroshorea leprosula TaxID=152421 RepID=A0AAV5J4I6_9ROSI|nr:hypothetical protein SLEP1_g17035 [Rubroshorea leprosula]
MPPPSEKGKEMRLLASQSSNVASSFKVCPVLRALLTSTITFLFFFYHP